MTTVRGVVCAVLFAASAVSVRGQGAPEPARPPALASPRVGLFDSVTVALRKHFPDSVLLWYSVEPAVAALKPAADSARWFGEELRVVQRLLKQIPVTSLSVLSASAQESLERGIWGRSEPMFGMHLMHWDGRWFAASVLDGGPAARAGVHAWDEVHSIDGLRPSESPALDYSQDDAYLDDSRDPPMHPLLASEGTTIRLRISHTLRDTVALDVKAARYSALDAAESSVRVVDLEGGVRVGVVHLWYVYAFLSSNWFGGRFDDQWKDIDALVLDLRGRGGVPDLADDVVDALSPGAKQRYRGPVVVLQDRQTRSAKEILIDKLRRRAGARLVGEPTAGSVRTSRAYPLGYGLVLNMPTRQQLPSAESRFELHPIDPDVAVTWGGPRAGSDPIYDAGIIEALRLIDTGGRAQVLPAPRPGPSKLTPPSDGPSSGSPATRRP